MTAYRSGEVPDAPVMASRADAAAYAAYRMPATVAATALRPCRRLRLSLPGWRRRRCWTSGRERAAPPGRPPTSCRSIESMTLLEQSAEAIRLGKVDTRGRGGGLPARGDLALLAAGTAATPSARICERWRAGGPGDRRLRARRADADAAVGPGRARPCRPPRRCCSSSQGRRPGIGGSSLPAGSCWRPATWSQPRARTSCAARWTSTGTGATSAPGCSARRCTGRPRARSCHTRTRSSATSRPSGQPQPARGPAARPDRAQAAAAQGAGHAGSVRAGWVRQARLVSKSKGDVPQARKSSGGTGGTKPAAWGSQRLGNLGRAHVNGRFGPVVALQPSMTIERRQPR